MTVLNVVLVEDALANGVGDSGAALGALSARAAALLLQLPSPLPTTTSRRTVLTAAAAAAGCACFRPPPTSSPVMSRRWTIDALAEKFRIRKQRVLAILALKVPTEGRRGERGSGG